MAKIKASRVIAIAAAEKDYLEKKNNNDLDSKKANAGSNNYTKYSRDLVKWIGSPYAQGVPWCDQFFDWCIIKACMEVENTIKKALELAKSILGGWSAYTPTSAQYYKNTGRWGSKPKVGAQIFFKNSTRICHTGVVTEVKNGYVYTMEGNTSSAAGVVANGGCVRAKSYAVGYSKIAGYGYPDYATERKAEQPKEDEYKEIIKNLQRALNKEYKAGLIVNGATDCTLLQKTPTLNIKTRNRKPNTVKALQQLLTYYGYKCTVDGDFYAATEKMVKAYQAGTGMAKPDGEVTALRNTWKTLLKL